VIEDDGFVRFLFFAQSADGMRTREMILPFSERRPLSQILQSDPRFSWVQERQNYLKVSINQEFADFETEVQGGDEVAILPPFSGG